MAATVSETGGRGVGETVSATGGGHQASATGGVAGTVSGSGTGGSLFVEGSGCYDGGARDLASGGGEPLGWAIADEDYLVDELVVVEAPQSWQGRGEGGQPWPQQTQHRVRS